MPPSQREETQDAANSEAAAAAVGSEGLFLTVSSLCTCGGRRWRGRSCSLQWQRATLLGFKGSPSDNCLHRLLLLLLRECGRGRVTTSDGAQYGTFSNYPVNGPICQQLRRWLMFEMCSVVWRLSRSPSAPCEGIAVGLPRRNVRYKYFPSRWHSTSLTFTPSTGAGSAPRANSSEPPMLIVAPARAATPQPSDHLDPAGLRCRTAPAADATETESVIQLV